MTEASLKGGVWRLLKKRIEIRLTLVCVAVCGRTEGKEF
jgi:hypothetical protein